MSSGREGGGGFHIKPAGVLVIAYGGGGGGRKSGFGTSKGDHPVNKRVQRELFRYLLGY